MRACDQDLIEGLHTRLAEFCQQPVSSGKDAELEMKLQLQPGETLRKTAGTQTLDPWRL